MFKFLQAAMSLARKGVKQEDILKFAKQEFGEVSDELKNIISRIYSRAKSQGSRIKDQEKGGEVIEASFKPGKSKYSDKVIEESPSQKSGIMSNVADRLAAEAKKLEQMMKESPSKAFEEMVLKSPARSGGPLDPRRGMVRTGARQFLQKEAREGRLKILDDRERDAITKGYQGGVDPIEVLRKYYGEDALEQIDLVSDELMDAQNYDEVLEILDKAGMKRFKARDIPGYDPNVRSSERIMKELEEKAKGNKAREDSLEDIKKFFKDDDPEDFATGGRVGYAFGTGKKLVQLFGGVKKLQKAIKDAVNNLNRTGDKKLDADMAIDDMLEEAGIDRDSVDQYDIIDAYGKAYDQIVKGADDLPGFPKIKSQSSKNILDDPKRQLTDDEIDELAGEVGELDAYDFDGTVGSANKIRKEVKEYEDYMYEQYKMGKLDPEPGDKSEARKIFLENKFNQMQATGDKKLMTRNEIEELEELQDLYGNIESRSKSVFDDVDAELEEKFPGVTKEIQSSKSVERLKLMEKYPGIDEKLLDQILIDDNPQRKAEMLATIDEAFKMMEKGMSPDEILDAIKKTPRTKQAEGGLSYLMGM